MIKIEVQFIAQRGRFLVLVLQHLQLETIPTIFDHLHIVGFTVRREATF